MRSAPGNRHRFGWRGRGNYLILLAAEEIQNIKWIRIKLAGSEREGEILKFDFEN